MHRALRHLTVLLTLLRLLQPSLGLLPPLVRPVLRVVHTRMMVLRLLVQVQTDEVAEVAAVGWYWATTITALATVRVAEVWRLTQVGSSSGRVGSQLRSRRMVVVVGSRLVQHVAARHAIPVAVEFSAHLLVCRLQHRTSAVVVAASSLLVVVVEQGGGTRAQREFVLLE